MTRQVTIYMTDEDRARVEELLNIKAEQGNLGVMDNRGDPSMSALIRLLVRQELEKENRHNIRAKMGHFGVSNEGGENRF